MNWAQIILVIAFGVMTIVGVVIMGVDKQKAKAGQWRIKEAALFAVAILFGGVGTTIGMYLFRHKTQHWYFALFFPLLAMLDIAVLAVGCYFLHKAI